jgi:hypothetical protein
MTYAEKRVPASYRLEKRSPPARYPATLADRLNALCPIAFALYALTDLVTRIPRLFPPIVVVVAFILVRRQGSLIPWY